jgi:hypothetical protein
MNKVLVFIVFLFLSGCSTVSEYNQGCLDGVEYVSGGSSQNHLLLCDRLERQRKDQERVDSQQSHR